MTLSGVNARTSVSRAPSSTADGGVSKPDDNIGGILRCVGTRENRLATGSGGCRQSTAGEGIYQVQLAQNVLHFKKGTSRSRQPERQKQVDTLPLRTKTRYSLVVRSQREASSHAGGSGCPATAQIVPKYPQDVNHC